MTKGLDIDILRTFHAVARFGRFKDAAVYVHRSASAITTQVQKLEEMVGQRLFVRSNQSVELTQAGRQFLAETTQFLMMHDRLVASLAPRFVSGKVRIGVPDGYAARFMTDFLPVFVAGNPGLELEVEARSSGELLEMFSRQQIDLTIAVSLQYIEQGELLGFTHPRWAMAEPFRFDESLPIPLALQLQGCPYRESALKALKAHGISYRILLESANWPAVEACIRSGLAVGILEYFQSDSSMKTTIPGMTLPTLPAHHVHLLSDSSNPVALHLHDVLKSTFHIQGCTPIDRENLT